MGKKSPDNSLNLSQSNRRRLRRLYYSRWVHMVASCYDRASPSFHLYGGQGIGVYTPWRNNFYRFALDIESEIGAPSAGKDVLGLVNANCGYRPGNMRWMSLREARMTPRCHGAIAESSVLSRRLERMETRNGISMETRNGISMEFQWNFNGISMETTV